MRRRLIKDIGWAALASALLLTGCSCWDVLGVRSQSPDDPDSSTDETTLIGDLAVPYGLFPVKVEAVGLVTGLQGTGGDPGPSVYRAALIDEMQTRGVPNPNSVLASPDTALVLIRGVLRPGIQEHERFDVEVRIPDRSETTSLRGGYLLQARLTEIALLNSQLRRGHLLAVAEGPVMVDPAADQRKDRVMRARGRILGGGVVLKSRPLGLVLKPGHQSVANSSRIEQAINKRFHTFRRGIQVGVAKAKTDQYVELAVHPRYHRDIHRYMEVVRAVALRSSATQRSRRIAELHERLLDPVTAAAAALQLEAIGSEAVEALKTALQQNDPEVRFRAAEALAYLDQREAAEPLGQIARHEPAFRVFALNALSTMNNFSAYEQLRELLSVPSAETRYGAFRALWAMNPEDPLVLGEDMGGQFSYHVLDVSGPPMVHVTWNRRPEIVLFGTQHHLLTPLAINAGNQIMITSHQPDEISVSKFSVDEPDQKRVVSTELDGVIRAIVELGGTYPDVVQALQEAKALGALNSRLGVDALPAAGRSYERSPQTDGDHLDDSGQKRPSWPLLGWLNLLSKRGSAPPGSAAPPPTEP